MLYKVRDFVNAGILKAIYHACLNHIFIMHALYGDKIYAKSIVFSYFKRKRQDWFIFKNVILILILSFSNQKWWNSLIKLKLKLVSSPANVSTTNYFPSLIAVLQPKVILRFLLILQQLMGKYVLLVWPQKLGIIFKVSLKAPW